LGSSRKHPETSKKRIFPGFAIFPSFATSRKTAKDAFIHVLQFF